MIWPLNRRSPVRALANSGPEKGDVWPRFRALPRLAFAAAPNLTRSGYKIARWQGGLSRARPSIDEIWPGSPRLRGRAFANGIAILDKIWLLNRRLRERALATGRLGINDVRPRCSPPLVRVFADGCPNID